MTWILFFIFVFALLLVLGTIIFMWKECILLLEKCFVKTTKLKKRMSSSAIVLQDMGKKKDLKKDDAAPGNVPHHTYLGKDIRKDILDQGTHELGTKFKILVSLFQIIMSFTTTFNLDWPSKFMSLVNGIATFLNFNVISIPFVGCLTEESYLSTFFLATLGPFFAIGLIYVVQRVWIKAGRPEEMFSRDDVQRYAFYILFLVYPRTSQVVLSMFRCYETADGASYLQVDFTVECSDTYSATIIPLAVIFTIVYPLGVPGLILYNLIQMKDHLFDPETGLSTGVAAKKLGAMYSMYRPSHYYWEVVESYRKLFICAILQFVDPESVSQIIVAIVFSTMYSMYFSYNNPMRDTSDNMLYMFAELEIFAVSFCALLLKSDLTTTENYDADTFDAIMILTLLIPNILFFTYLFTSLYINFFGDALLGYEHTRRLYPAAADSVGFCSYISSNAGETLFKDESERKTKELEKLSPDLSDSIMGLNMTYQRLVVSRRHMSLSKSVSREVQLCADLIASSGDDTHSKWLSDVCRAFNRVLMQINDEGLAVRELDTLNRVLKECPCQVKLSDTERESIDENVRFGWRTWTFVRALRQSLDQQQQDLTTSDKKKSMGTNKVPKHTLGGDDDVQTHHDDEDEEEEETKENDQEDTKTGELHAV